MHTRKHTGTQHTCPICVYAYLYMYVYANIHTHMYAHTYTHRNPHTCLEQPNPTTCRKCEKQRHKFFPRNLIHLDGCVVKFMCLFPENCVAVCCGVL